jgi:hypothetical protein
MKYFYKIYDNHIRNNNQVLLMIVNFTTLSFSFLIYREVISLTLTFIFASLHSSLPFVYVPLDAFTQDQRLVYLQLPQPQPPLHGPWQPVQCRKNPASRIFGLVK